MGSIVSAIGAAINAIVSAIAAVIETIVSAIVGVRLLFFSLLLNTNTKRHFVQFTDHRCHISRHRGHHLLPVLHRATPSILLGRAQALGSSQRRGSLLVRVPVLVNP